MGSCKQLEKKIGYILIIFIFLSCNRTEEKNTSNIEIYLTKNRIESYQGVKLENVITDSLKIFNMHKRWGEKPIRIDTTNSQLILAGAYEVNQKDLQNKPFIKFDEIISFNKDNGTLTLNKIAINKLSKIKSDSFGQQFVLTINGKPEIIGYFYQSAYSYGSNTYHYPYLQNFKVNKELELYHGLELRSVDIKSEFPNLYKQLN